MKSVSASVKRTIAGAAIAAFATVGPTLSLAEETTTTTTEKEVSATTTEEKICEAEQRTEARWQKWINQGIPEEFGSEEPFTFDPTKC